MRLELYITDLLFRHDCVIVPGIGAFISRSLPSEIESNTNMFRPSRKQLAFNASMKQTDGLLVGYVSRVNKWSFEFAAQQVDKAVMNWKHELSQGKKIKLEYIGQLYYSEQSTLQFLPAINSNFSLDSFGMGIFHVPAVSDSTIQKARTDKAIAIAEESLSPDLAAKTGKSWTAWKWAAVLVPLIALSSIAWTQRQGLVSAIESYSNVGPVIFGNKAVEQVDNAEFEGVKGLPKKSVIPFNSESSTAASTSGISEENNDSAEKVEEVASSRKAEIVAESEPTKSEAASEEISSTTSDESDKTIIKTVEKTPIKNTVVKEASVSNESFYIIVGSFREASNGNRMISSLRAKGYDAEVAPGNGLSRVSAMSFASKQQAIDALQEIKEKVEAGAWIYNP